MALVTLQYCHACKLTITHVNHNCVGCESKEKEKQYKEIREKLDAMSLEDRIKRLEDIGINKRST